MIFAFSSVFGAVAASRLDRSTELEERIRKINLTPASERLRTLVQNSPLPWERNDFEASAWILQQEICQAKESNHTDIRIIPRLLDSKPVHFIKRVSSELNGIFKPQPGKEAEKQDKDDEAFQSFESSSEEEQDTLVGEKIDATKRPSLRLRFHRET